MYFCSLYTFPFPLSCKTDSAAGSAEGAFECFALLNHKWLITCPYMTVRRAPENSSFSDFQPAWIHIHRFLGHFFCTCGPHTILVPCDLSLRLYSRLNSSKGRPGSEHLLTTLSPAGQPESSGDCLSQPLVFTCLWAFNLSSFPRWRISLRFILQGKRAQQCDTAEHVFSPPCT